MKEQENRPQGDGTDFINQQRNLDRAKNERINSEKSRKGKDLPADKDDVTVKTDVSKKKTGGGEQVSPGT